MKSSRLHSQKSDFAPSQSDVNKSDPPSRAEASGMGAPDGLSVTVSLPRRGRSPEGRQVAHGGCTGGGKPEVRTRRASYRLVPIQFGWSFLSDREKRCITGIPTATYTAKVQAGKSVIKSTTSHSAAVATNAIGSSLDNRSDLFWVMLVRRVIGRRTLTAEPVRVEVTPITITPVSSYLTTQYCAPIIPRSAYQKYQWRHGDVAGLGPHVDTAPTKPIAKLADLGRSLLNDVCRCDPRPQVGCWAERVRRCS